MPSLDEYTIVLFCPLVIEQQAAYLMLDEVHDGITERSIGQNVLYTLGRIASHKVAIAGYPVGEVGLGVSGSMVTEVLRDFPNIEFGLLVGIGAGIPSPTQDIRLGDVAVAVPNRDNPGVIGYDLVKVEEGEVRLKQWQNSTHPLLRSAITSIRVHEGRPEFEFTRHLNVVERAAAFRRPTQAWQFSGLLSPGTQEEHDRDEPRAHYGTILSGNGVIKSKVRREELRDRFGGIAIEMEAAGMMTRLPVAVIRGISDFADENKADDWHPYAALTAAAYAKEIIIRLGPLKKTETSSQSMIISDLDAHLSLSMPEPCKFVGRAAELARLEEWLGIDSRKMPQKFVVALWGLSGIGKTQLVAAFVRKQKERHPDHAFYWANAESQETFERSIVSMLKVGQNSTTASEDSHESKEEYRQLLVKSFFTELHKMNWRKWTLIIDNMDSSQSARSMIQSYIGGIACGSILVILRTKEAAQTYHHRMEVKGLEVADATNLLRMEIDEQFQGRNEDVHELCEMLKCHPLSLRLAASNISCYPVSVAQHIRRWKSRDDGLSTDSNILRSFQMSFEQLENVDPLATNLLKLFGFLDHKDMWYDLCLGTIRDEEPDWVRELASKRRFQEVLTRLHNLSFVEVKLGQNGEEPTYEIHPAIHEFARSRARGEEVEELVRCAVSLVAARVPRSNAQGFIKTIHRLEPHAEQCLIHMKQGRTGCHIDLVELEKFGSLFRHLGRYDEATRLYEGILHMLRAEDQPDEATIELTAGIENNLGLIYHARQKYDVALQLYQNSCERLSEMPVEDEKASQITAYNAGRSFMMLGKLDKALREFNQAEQYFSRVLQESPMSDCRDGQWYIYFRIINDIGEIHLRQKNVDLAEQCFRTSFDGFKRCFYELHPVTFTVRLNMGRVCMEQSRYVTAKKIFDFIVDTYTGWWGRRHSETMRAVAELADSYMRHGEAKQLMGDGGERELSVATELYSEVFKYHQEVRGTNSGTAFLMSQKLERLQSLSYSTSGDKYGEYYSMNS